MQQNTTGVSLQGYVPVRKDPFERSEMTTQVLFGETVEINDDEGKWLYIKLLNDGYEGWVDKKCIFLSDLKIAEEIHFVVKSQILINSVSSDNRMQLPVGSVIPGLENDTFTIADQTFTVNEPNNLAGPGNADLQDVINGVLGVPYIWGGRSGYGFDCSGLTQYLCRVSGIAIPRDASEQAAIGETVNFLSEAKTGDLAFFDDTAGLIHHVGMIIDNNRIVHASGRVRIDPIDHQGIYNEETGEYTHKLRVLKRM